MKEISDLLHRKPEKTDVGSLAVRRLLSSRSPNYLIETIHRYSASWRKQGVSVQLSPSGTQDMLVSD